MSLRLKLVVSTLITSISLFPVCNILTAQSILLSPDTLYMGQIPTNSKAMRQLSITNIDSKDLHISSINLSNTNGFRLLNNPGTKTLKLLEMLILEIEFSPSSGGYCGSVVSIASDAKSGQSSLIIQGIGLQSSKITFERIFTDQYGETSSVSQTNDGGYVLGGSATLPSAFYSNFYVVKTDSLGDIQWSKSFAYGSYDGNSSVAKVLQTSDGGYIVLGNTSSTGATGVDVYLARLDPTGRVIWQKTYGGKYDDNAASIVKTSSGYMIAGSTMSYGDGSSDIYVVKIDDSGNEIWHHNYGGAGGDTGSQIISTKDGNFVIVGTTSSFGASGAFDIYLFKIDGSGNKIWDKLYGGSDWDEGNSVAELSDGSLVIAGFAIGFGPGARDMFLVKTNASGVEQWHKAFGGIYQDNASKVVTTSDGIIVSGTQTIGIKNTVSSGNVDILVIKIDLNGNQSWKSQFGRLQNEAVGDMIINGNGNVIIAGSTSSYGGNYFLNINPQGSITHVLEEQDHKLPSDFQLFANYPNPFNNQTQITFQLPEQSLVELDICNVIGQRLVTLFDGIKSAGKYSIGFNADEFSSGVYFCQLKSTFGIRIQKMLLLK